MFNLGRFMRVPIKFHWSGFLMPVAAYQIFGFSLTGLVFGIFIVLSIFLHEFGHVLMGRRFGSRTDSVTLSWYGGVARMHRNLSYKKDILVLLAGPAVNLAIAAVVGISFFLPATSELCMYLFGLNLGLAAFNLLPVVPLDGGQILQNLVAMRYGPAKAKRFIVPFSMGAIIVLMGASVFFLGMGAIRLCLFGLLGLYLLWQQSKTQG